MDNLEATITLCNRLNPEIGYHVKITKYAENGPREGEVILFTSCAPDSGEDIISFNEAVRIVTMYTTPAKLTY
jgi:hypothetical protein